MKASRLRAGLEVTTIAEAGINSSALDVLLQHARASQTDAFVLLRDGRVVVEEYFGGRAKPIMAMSATKSVVSIALGALANEDPTFSIDDRISATVKTWRFDALKARVTVRNILSHTSGLATDRARQWRGESIEDTLLAAPMLYEPGADFRYNNAATDFLSVLVWYKTDWYLDDFLEREVFGPLGIAGASWLKDERGHPTAAGELIIAPIDLAKLGQLMLQDGVWNGVRVLAKGWVAASLRPSQHFDETCGLLWWLDAPQEHRVTPELLDDWRHVGVSSDVVAKIAAATAGRVFATRKEVRESIRTCLSADELASFNKTLLGVRVDVSRVKLTGPVRAFMAEGWLGQWLVVVPSTRLVAVRMHARRGSEMGSDLVNYETFVEDVRALASTH